MKWWHQSGAAAKRKRIRNARPDAVVDVEEERARSRARVRCTLQSTSRACSYCSDRETGFESLALPPNESQRPDDVFILFCRKHRSQAIRELAVGHMRALEGDDPWPAMIRSDVLKKHRPRAVPSVPQPKRSGFDIAAAHFQRLPIPIQSGILEQARAFRGLTLSTESPLYRQRFAALVAEARNLLGDDTREKKGNGP